MPTPTERLLQELEARMAPHGPDWPALLAEAVATSHQHDMQRLAKRRPKKGPTNAV